jgi:hypothetical protein
MRQIARTSDTVTNVDALEQALIEVWRQVLIENASVVQIGGREYLVLTTSKLKLREVDFEIGKRELRGLEQNPKTGSRWALLARSGKKVMQFLERRRYIAAVVDGKAFLYKKHGEA